MEKYLIVGITSGIGSEVGRRLKGKGHFVCGTSRCNDKLEAIGEVWDKGFVVNAANFGDLEKLVQQLQDIGDEFDGMVCCAGSILLKSGHLTTYEEYEDTITASLTTAFSVVRVAGKYMGKKGGSVVLMGSCAGLQGIANHEAISAAKAGVIGLARAAAATYAPMNIRFNVVAPGLTDTPLSKHLTSNEATLKFSEKMHPLGRIGKVADIASAVEFFLDSKNNWITGQVLAVDGGISRVIPKR